MLLLFEPTYKYRRDGVCLSSRRRIVVFSWLLSGNICLRDTTGVVLRCGGIVHVGSRERAFSRYRLRPYSGPPFWPVQFRRKCYMKGSPKRVGIFGRYPGSSKYARTLRRGRMGRNLRRLYLLSTNKYVNQPSNGWLRDLTSDPNRQRSILRVSCIMLMTFY